MYDFHFLVWDKLYRSRVHEGRSHVTVPLWSNRGRGLVSKKKPWIMNCNIEDLYVKKCHFYCVCFETKSMPTGLGLITGNIGYSDVICFSLSSVECCTGSCFVSMSRNDWDWFHLFSFFFFFFFFTSCTVHFFQIKLLVSMHSVLFVCFFAVNMACIVLSVRNTCIF